MNMELISVIVPVYNVEQYLERCVESIRNQTYSNLEIVLVDDGSPDRCPVLCEELKKADPRIKVVHKENGGLSSARNAGLLEAAGEYVWFVDSDDWIEPDALALLQAAATSPLWTPMIGSAGPILPTCTKRQSSTGRMRRLVRILRYRPGVSRSLIRLSCRKSCMKGR